MLNPAQLWSGMTGNGSNTDAASYATASVGCVSGQGLLACITTYKATTPDIPTCSGTNGWSGTWTQVATVTIGSDLRLTIFRAVAVSGTAGVVTFDFGGNTQLAAVWALMQSPHVAAVSVVQSKTATDTSAGTTLTVTLDAALAHSHNWVLAIFAQRNAGSFFCNTFSYLLQGTTAISASDGVSMRVYIDQVIATTAGGLTGSVSKVAIALEMAHDGIGLGLGSALVGSGGLVR